MTCRRYEGLRSQRKATLVAPRSKGSEVLVANLAQSANVPGGPGGRRKSWADLAYPARRRNLLPRFAFRGAAAIPRTIHVVAAASPRPVPAGDRHGSTSQVQRVRNLRARLVALAVSAVRGGHVQLPRHRAVVLHGRRHGQDQPGSRLRRPAVQRRRETRVVRGLRRSRRARRGRVAVLHDVRPGPTAAPSRAGNQIARCLQRRSRRRGGVAASSRHLVCARRGAGVLLNISAKFWRISSPDRRAVGYRAGTIPASTRTFRRRWNTRSSRATARSAKATSSASTRAPRVSSGSSKARS